MKGETNIDVELQNTKKASNKLAEYLGWLTHIKRTGATPRWFDERLCGAKWLGRRNQFDVWLMNMEDGLMLVSTDSFEWDDGSCHFSPCEIDRKRWASHELGAAEQMIADEFINRVHLDWE